MNWDELAERGWVLAHAQQEDIVELPGGRYERVPALFRAEKTLDGATINQAASTEEDLRVAIEAWEAAHDRRVVASEAPALEPAESGVIAA